MPSGHSDSGDVVSIAERRKVWLAKLDALGRQMDDVEARIDRIVGKLLPWARDDELEAP
jgi:hypothetical protein